MVIARITDTVNRRHGSDDDHVRPFQQGLGGRQAHLLDVFVDARILLDEQIAAGDVGLRLVVVVIRNKILDRVLRKNSRISAYSCAASVLFGAITIAGRPVRR